jgi:hypothetical protein
MESFNPTHSNPNVDHLQQTFQQRRGDSRRFAAKPEDLKKVSEAILKTAGANDNPQLGTSEAIAKRRSIPPGDPNTAPHTPQPNLDNPPSHNVPAETIKKSGRPPAPPFTKPGELSPPTLNRIPVPSESLNNSSELSRTPTPPKNPSPPVSPRSSSPTLNRAASSGPPEKSVPKPIHTTSFREGSRGVMPSLIRSFSALVDKNVEKSEPRELKRTLTVKEALTSRSDSIGAAARIVYSESANKSYNRILGRVESQIAELKKFPEGEKLENKIADVKKENKAISNTIGALEKDMAEKKALTPPNNTEIKEIETMIQSFKTEINKNNNQIKNIETELMDKTLANNDKIGRLERLEHKMKTERQVVMGELNENMEVPGLILMGRVKFLSNIIESSNFAAIGKDLENKLTYLEAKTIKSPEDKENIVLYKALKEKIETNPEIVKQEIEAYKNETVFIDQGPLRFLAFSAMLDKNMNAVNRLLKDPEGNKDKLANVVIPPENMTKLDGIALLIYSSSAYKNMNATLRKAAGDESKVKDPGVRDLNKSVQDALRKLPDYKIEPGKCLYRAIFNPSTALKNSFLTSEADREVDRQHAFTSTSAKPVPGGEVSLEIYPRNGDTFPGGKKFGFPFSLWGGEGETPGEAEVLFVARTDFTQVGEVQGDITGPITVKVVV